MRENESSTLIAVFLLLEESGFGAVIFFVADRFNWMSSLQEWFPLRWCIRNSGQLDAFLGFANSQRMAPKTTVYPDAVLFQLLKTCLAKTQDVQQVQYSSVLEAEAANPVPEDFGRRDRHRHEETLRVLLGRAASRPPSRSRWDHRS